MAVVAIVQDGKWVPVDDGRPPANPKADMHMINAPMSDPVDLIVAHLAEVVRLAQNLNSEDQRRIRDFVHATSAMLSATTYLNGPDQRAFEKSLRGG